MENSIQQDHEGVWPWHYQNKTHDIYYHEVGEGNNHIVLLHGFAFHSATWNKVIGQLVEKGFHVWALDFIGHGKSDKPLDIDYNSEVFSQQVISFIEEKKLIDCVLIGNSMGGAIAVNVTNLIPQNIRSLILIDAYLFDIKLPIYLLLGKIFGRLATPFMGRGSTKALLQDIIYDHSKITEELITTYSYPLYTKNGRAAVTKMLGGDAEKDLSDIRSICKEIKKPMLIIWGKNDRWMPDEYYQNVVKLFPEAKTVVIPNCGHITQEECPEETFRAIFEFIK